MRPGPRPVQPPPSSRSPRRTGQRPRVPSRASPRARLRASGIRQFHGRRKSALARAATRAATALCRERRSWQPEPSSDHRRSDSGHSRWGRPRQPDSERGPASRARIPGAECYIVKGAQHGYHFEHREEASRVVRDFLMRHPLEPKW